MDMDKELVRSVLREGKDAYLDCIGRDLNAEDHLFGEGKAAWQFIADSYRTHGELPPLGAVEGATGFDLSGSNEGISGFYLGEIFKRRLFLVQRDGIEQVSNSLAARDPDGAAEIWAEIHRKIQTESLTVRKVESLLALGSLVIEDYEDAKAGKRGIATPWPSMDDQTLGWWPEDLILFVGRLGVGKCVHEDTEIVDPTTGIPKAIRDVYSDESHHSVTTWSKDGGVFATPITAKVDTGRKECIEITMSSGRSVIVTPEHPVLTPDGWVNAENISVNDSLALPAKMPFPESPVAMDDPVVDILAILLAEGSYTGNHVGFSNIDEDILSIARDAAHAIGAEVVYRSGCDYDFTGVVDRVSIVGKILRDLGIDKKKAVSKTIPDEVYQLPPIQLSRFLSIFWMCDGYVDDTGPTIVLASERMVRQIQSLLLRFGIQSSVSYKKSSCNGKDFDSWRLRVYASSWESFSVAISLWGEKLESFTELLGRDRNSNVGFPKISEKLKARIREIADPGSGRWNGGKLVKVGQALGWNSKFMFRSLFGKGDSLLIRRFKVFCEIFDCCDEFKWLWGADIFWDSVLSVKSVGEQKIYDLTVEPTSCFIGNDIILHNTWALVICAHAAWRSRQHNVLIVSTEMNKRQMARRFFSLHLNLPYNEVRRGKLGEFVESKLYAGVDELLKEKGMNIIAGDFDYSIDNIAAVVEDEKPHLLCVDGPYLIKNSGKDRHERVSNNFDDFKKIGKRTGVATITNLQFNRSAKTGQDQTISADNIGITDVAGWNADSAYGMMQDEDMRSNAKLNLKALKIREGVPGTFEINWNHSTMDFTEVGGDGGPGLPPPVGPDTGGGDAMYGVSDEVDDSGDYGDVPF